MITETKPLFSSVEECLRWAHYGHNLGDSETIQLSSVNRFVSRDSREQIADDSPAPKRRDDIDIRPRSYDAAAQAGLIQSYITRLTPEESAHLRARYLLGPDRRQAQQFLRDWTLLMIDCGEVPKPLIYELVAKFYGKKSEELRLRSLQKRFGLTRYRMGVINRQVYIVLDALAHRADRKAYDYLQEGGVVK